MRELLPGGFTGTLITENMVEVAANVAIRLVTFTPEAGTTGMPVVMVVGLATRMESFRDILMELSKHVTIFYIETREKSSSEISGKACFDMNEHGRDIAKVIAGLDLFSAQYALMGYSFGATAILEAYPLLPAKPRAVLLMEPTPAFRYPAWAKLLIRLAVPLYPVMKAFAKWYLRQFYINTKDDAEMAVISSRALDHADPQKLRDSILAIAGYEVWDRLALVECPALIVATSKDGLHTHADIMRMATSLKKCSYVDMETNKRSHSAELAVVTLDYLEGIGN
jgi:pimeloyl-ACP methyl ester carboxylesterase